MKYVSSRGEAAPVDFTTACLAGLAPDGGLYVPDTWPRIAPATGQESYTDIAVRILSAFAGKSMDEATLRQLCDTAYASFSHQSVAPLVQAGPSSFLMELHHGPTLAFKDVAMQFIAAMYDHVLQARGERMTVICATSGDTGGAAAAAFAGKSAIDLIILHPHERVSPIQRLFMTTTGADNVHNLALHGDFDSCQAIVKTLFADKAFVRDVALSGVNSINWARIAAQSAYYAAAQATLGFERALRFVVPSGNMGDSLAGYVAARCGLLNGFEAICAVNENRSLERLFRAGEMQQAKAVATPSPAMDISVPSNFERLLFEVSGRDAELVRNTYRQYAQSGSATLPDRVRGPLGCTGLSAQSVSNSDTMNEIRQVFDETGWLICPHTAVGTRVARNLPASDAATVVLATAHAAKFPETVAEATGQTAALPQRCASLLQREEAFHILPADTGAVRDFILARRCGS